MLNSANPGTIGRLKRRPPISLALNPGYTCASILVAWEDSVGDQVKFTLDEKDIPKAWYNLAADLPQPLPPVLHPGTKQPVGPSDLEPLFPMALILQEVSAERFIDIPEPIRDVYRMWRPSPLMRAHRLEKALGTPAKIYYKYEGVSPAGSHQPAHAGR